MEWHPDLEMTARTRQVLEFAEADAVARQHEYVGTAHLLAGIAATGQGVALEVLDSLGLPRDQVTNRLGGALKQGFAQPTLVRSPTAKCRRALDLAEAEARRLGHDHVGTEHILLGVLSEPSGLAATVLTQAGITADAVRTEILRRVGSADGNASIGTA